MTKIEQKQDEIITDLKEIRKILSKVIYKFYPQVSASEEQKNRLNELDLEIEQFESDLAQLKAEAEVSDEAMYDYISFANYFHKWKEKIQRGVCPIRPDEVFNEWQTSEYRKECKAHRDGLLKKG